MGDISLAPSDGGAVLALLAQLAIIAAGFAVMLRLGKYAVRLLLLGVFLAAVAGLAPTFTG